MKQNYFLMTILGFVIHLITTNYCYSKANTTIEIGLVVNTVKLYAETKGDMSFIGDVNGNGKTDLVLVNTSNSGGAIRAIDITTEGNIAYINHGTFDGWMDVSDKMFLMIE